MLGARYALAVVLVASAVPAAAQATPPGRGGEAAPDFAAVPVLQARAPGSAAVGAGLRYGYTEDVLEGDDSHHRVGLGLAGSYALVSWAALGASVDLRYDSHSGGSDDGDGGTLGQSRLHARADHEVVPGTRLGGELALRFPPAADFGAGASSMSGELLGVATHTIGARTLLSGVLGYRLDRSSHAVDDATRLSASDRMALGASDSDALRVGAAGAYDAGPVVALLALGWDVLIGSRAPSALQSPIRLSLGARRELMRALWLEGLATFSLSQRPDPGETALVPIEPRVLLGASVSYGFGGRVAAAPSPKPAPPPPPPPPAPSPQLGSLLGQVVDVDGAPVLGARVSITSLGREAPCDHQGRFSLSELPPDTYELYAQAPGWQPVTLRLEVAAGDAELRVTLVERLPVGQIRGTVRGKYAAPVAAEISIAPLGTRLHAAEDGTFALDVAPGSYQVTITAPGYELQQRQIEVEHNGVTVLLVDLRSAE